MNKKDIKSLIEDINVTLLPSGELLVDTKYANEAKSVRLMDREGFTREFVDRPQGEWIPCEERMPAESEGSYGCIVTVMDTDIKTGEEFENILPYPVGYDGKIWIDDEGCECPFEVIAWMPLPKPYEDGKEYRSHPNTQGSKADRCQQGK